MSFQFQSETVSLSTMESKQDRSGIADTEKWHPYMIVAHHINVLKHYRLGVSALHLKQELSRLNLCYI